MKFTKSMTAAAALALAIGVAGPACADSGTGSSGTGSSSSSGTGTGSSGNSSGSSHAATTIDQQFLQAIKGKGIHMADRQAISLAHSTCAGLKGGGTVNDALMNIKKGSTLTDKDAMTFGGMAVYTYCRQYLPKNNG